MTPCGGASQDSGSTTSNPVYVCVSPLFNRPVHVLRQIHPHGFIFNDTEMAAALKPFNDYMTYLATGKLDIYFDCTKSADIVTDLKVTLPDRPMLLLHDLGNYPHDVRLTRLFKPDTVFVFFFFEAFSLTNIAWCSHLFAVSGSRKTRLCLEGFCHQW